LRCRRSRCAEGHPPSMPPPVPPPSRAARAEGPVAKRAVSSHTGGLWESASQERKSWRSRGARVERPWWPVPPGRRRLGTGRPSTGGPAQRTTGRDRMTPASLAPRLLAPSGGSAYCVLGELVTVKAMAAETGDAGRARAAPGRDGKSREQREGATGPVVASAGVPVGPRDRRRLRRLHGLLRGNSAHRAVLCMDGPGQLPGVPESPRAGFPACRHAGDAPVGAGSLHPRRSCGPASHVGGAWPEGSGDAPMRRDREAPMLVGGERPALASVRPGARGSGMQWKSRR
jgi:hypothetical protein